MTRFIGQLNNAFDPAHLCNDGQPLCSLQHPSKNGIKANTFGSAMFTQHKLYSLTKERVEEAFLILNENCDRDKYNDKYGIREDINRFVRTMYVSPELEFIARRVLHQEMNYYIPIRVVFSLTVGYWFITVAIPWEDSSIDWRDIFGARDYNDL
jgi:hypothetical protein